ncbi:hypothetical protein EYC80_005734 [Monilinia laxa]|uniref:Uncharacterized protein n=1 Tax=Monilinia laxa TaxID=61186 RepID=A0A5N6KF32_MONLA|nr:hypothetical protein EYC80_005734 [Monilinia laxa]
MNTIYSKALHFPRFPPSSPTQRQFVMYPSCARPAKKDRPPKRSRCLFASKRKGVQKKEIRGHFVIEKMRRLVKGFKDP